MNNLLAAALLASIPLTSIALVYFVMSVYDRIRSARLQAAIKEIDRPQLLLPEDVDIKFDEDDLDIDVNDVGGARFKCSEFPTPKDRAQLLLDLKHADPFVSSLYKVKEDGEDYICVRRSGVTNPESIPMPTAVEMEYHMAGHAAAGVALGEMALERLDQDLRGHDGEEVQTQAASMAEEMVARVKLETVIRSIDPKGRQRVRELLDQADADDAADDEEFYQKALEEAADTFAVDVVATAVKAVKKIKKPAKKAKKKAKKPVKKVIRVFR